MIPPLFLFHHSLHFCYNTWNLNTSSSTPCKSKSKFPPKVKSLQGAVWMQAHLSWTHVQRYTSLRFRLQLSRQGHFQPGPGRGHLHAINVLCPFEVHLTSVGAVWILWPVGQYNQWFTNTHLRSVEHLACESTASEWLVWFNEVCQPSDITNHYPRSDARNDDDDERPYVICSVQIWID